MIDPHSQTLRWIQTVSVQQKISDKVLLEKTIRALTLLECLVAQDLQFVFKGGTALMLLLQTSRRLSIDIDIIMVQAREDLMSQLQLAAARGGFLRVEEHARGHRTGLRKAHFKFWYVPSFQTNQKEDYVLLDIVFEPIRYLKVTNLPITSPLLMQSDIPMLVPMPSVEDILGDKLTAFAPATTGIPYFKDGVSKSMEIIKQLFDIGCLFDLVEDLDRLQAAFFAFVRSELAYRSIESQDLTVVLNDIIDTAYCISTRGKYAPQDFGELQAGIQRVQSFIFSESYHLDKAITHAAKAAYLAKAIMANAEKLYFFDREHAIGLELIAGAERNHLNKLKKSNLEAFFFWHQALALDAG